MLLGFFCLSILFKRQENCVSLLTDACSMTFVGAFALPLVSILIIKLVQMV